MVSLMFSEEIANALKKFALGEGSHRTYQMDWELFLKDFLSFVGHELGTVEGMPPFESYLFYGELLSQVSEPEYAEHD
jgi:hypothetical protein